MTGGVRGYLRIDMRLEESKKDIFLYTNSKNNFPLLSHTRGCIKKFPDWSPGARTAHATALCHYVKLYRYFVSQSSEFCFHTL